MDPTMDFSALFIASLLVAALAGLVSWMWSEMGRVDSEFLSFSKFEAANFEIGPQVQQSSESARWPGSGR